ncbi:MAG: uroporphyrinogen decarboxylase [Nitrospirae bacterium]|jgi:uroporphyrinogen decarboxylase|nr:uroporphyrinogen decarboxylase [Nitrospirota bacterium]
MNDTFLKVCRGEKADYTPVWLMRQAGRYMPQYQAIRSNIDFLTLCKNPKFAAEVTLQPVDVLGVDAAILFSDILIVVEPMGMRLEFSEKEGPVLSEPVRNKSAVDKLIVPEIEQDLPFVLETIKILREELKDKVPLIGFSGSPFTLATYMIEGGTSKNFVNTKKLMFQNSSAFHYLMDKLTDTVSAYLLAQIKSGAQAVQIFDTWAGILTPQDFRIYVLPYIKKLIKELKKTDAPVIYFVNECAGILSEIKKCGADIIGVDWRIDLSDAIKKLGKKIIIQGNLDPCALFLPKEKLEDRIKDILWKGESARGHIFNLGHGILPQTPVENVITLVEAVHTFSR